MTKVLGWTINEYHEAILSEMKPDYEWYTEDMLWKIDKVTIARISRLVDERRDRDLDDPWAEDPLNTAEEAVAALCHDIRQHIEWSPGMYLKHVAAYNVDFEPQELSGWMLENYRFDKYEGDVFFSSVTAGDRCTGSGRTFYIPQRLIKGHTYEEFLRSYFDEVANPRFFGLGVEALIDDTALKAFFGFTES